MVPSPGNPQSLNRYGYTLGNPLKFTDPTGHYAFEEDPDDPVSFGTNVRSQHDYTHPDYRAGNQSDAQFLSGATAPIWVPLLAIFGAEEVGELAGNAHWGIRKIMELVVGGACADGDCTNEATAGAKTATEYLGNVYRNATGKPDSLTPRLGQDVLTPLKNGEIPGLSTFTSSDKLNPGKYVAIDTTKLTNLQAILDDPAKGHVTITPGDLPQLLQWSLRRGTTVAMDLAHRFTQEVYQAITFTGKK
jgi:hypothetical protein